MTLHLNDPVLRALLAGDPLAPELLAHLEADCEVCDHYLTSTRTLDGEVDEVLLSQVGASEAPLDEVGWKRLRKRLEPRSSRWVVAALAMAAGLTVLVATQANSGTTSGEKGSAVGAASLALRAAAQRPDGSLTPVGQGGVVSDDETLLFEATVAAPVPATLWVKRGEAVAQKLGSLELSAGTHPLRMEESLLGFSLRGERGALSVWLIAGEEVLSPELLLGQTDTGARGFSSRLDVTVVPGVP